MKTISHQSRKWDIIARQFSSRYDNGIVYTLKLYGISMRDVREGDIIAVHEDDLNMGGDSTRKEEYLNTHTTSDSYEVQSLTPPTIKLVVNR